MTLFNTQRLLPRSGRAIAPVIWSLERTIDAAAIALAREALPSAWFFLPASAAGGPIDLPDSAEVIAGVQMQDLLPRRSRAVQDRLASAFHRSHCQAVMLESVAVGEIKAGGPFHRLSQLRDQGVTELFLAWAQDHAEAEWLLHHTPAHAICLPFGLEDQLAKYRLLRDAQGFGTGIIARLPQTDPARLAMQIAFVLGEPGITSILLPVWAHAAIATASTQSITDEQRREAWDDFRSRVPEPDAMKRGGEFEG